MEDQQIPLLPSPFAQDPDGRKPLEVDELIAAESTGKSINALDEKSSKPPAKRAGLWSRLFDRRGDQEVKVIAKAGSRPLDSGDSAPSGTMANRNSRPGPPKRRSRTSGGGLLGRLIK